MACHVQSSNTASYLPVPNPPPPTIPIVFPLLFISLPLLFFLLAITLISIFSSKSSSHIVRIVQILQPYKLSNINGIQPFFIAKKFAEMPQQPSDTIKSSDTQDYNSRYTLFRSNMKYTARDDMMGRLYELLMLYLQEAFYFLLAESIVFLLFEVPMDSLADILLCPVLAVPVTDTIDVLAFCCISATASSFFEVLITFPQIAPKDLRDFMLDAFYHAPVAADTPVADWEGNRPIYLCFHYGFVVFVLLFIFLSLAAGIMIQPEVPSWRPTYPSYAWLARICATPRARLAQILGACLPIPSQVLDWSAKTNQALFIVAYFAWMILFVILAAWTTNILATTFALSSLLWSGVLSGLRWTVLTPTPCLGGSSTDDQVFCWGQSPVLYLRSITAGLADWYDNMYEDDSVRHFPIFTIPIAVGLTAIACKLLWQDKYQGLFTPEFVREETRLKDAVLLDYQTFLAGLVSKIDGPKEVLVDMSGLLASVLAQNKELYNRLLSLQTENSELEKKLDRLPWYACTSRQYADEALSLRRQTTALQTELDALRRDTDGNMALLKIQTLNTQLAALHQELEVLRKADLEKEQELRSLHQAVSTATSKATEAEKRADHLSQECSNQATDAESLRQEYSKLFSTCEQLSTDKQTLAQQLHEASNKTQLAENLAKNMQSSWKTGEERVCSLMTELATLKAQYDSCVNELGKTTQRLDDMTATLKFRSEELGATKTELDDKTTALAQLTNTLRQTEYRLAELEPSVTQVIHNQQKQNEARQLRDKLDKERAENRVLRETMSQQETELRQLRSQAMGPSPSASLSRSKSDPDLAAELERLRKDLRDKEEELRRATIQLSNTQMANRRSGSSPFMPPRRR